MDEAIKIRYTSKSKKIAKMKFHPHVRPVTPKGSSRLYVSFLSYCLTFLKPDGKKLIKSQITFSLVIALNES